MTLVDYGLGNIQAFASIYKYLGIPYRVAKNASELSHSSHLILPGVGAFDWAIERLERSGMRQSLDDLVINHNVPVLGVCVGMQMMANRSDEGQLPGLGWIPGEVKRLDSSLLSTRTALPHMGWNDVLSVDHPLFTGISNPRYYFLHSYFFSPHFQDHEIAQAEYGHRFAAAVGRDHVLGVQFHPEKSHQFGVHLLKNFAKF